MSTYIIGDVQGCYQALQQLLATINFSSRHDHLGFVGDLVNRGEDSLNVLRFIRSLQSPLVVLGNHDFYLLILGYGCMPEDPYPHHTLQDIFSAPDKLDLLDWLRHQPLILHEENNQSTLVHAGIPPQWSIAQSITYAHEIETQLKDDQQFESLLTHLFGNTPHAWHPQLTDWDRLRYITNALTRMRFCDEHGELDLFAKGAESSDLKHYQPWFSWRESRHVEEKNLNLFFGHWAALNGVCHIPHYYALDTGCIWGKQLTAIRLEDKKRFSIPCTQR